MTKYKESEMPKYKAIFEALQEDLTSGKYKTNDRLPSEGALGTRFGVSRMTVIAAMRELQREGLVVRRVGSGTYVAPQKMLGGGTFGLLIPELGKSEIFEPICQGMTQLSKTNKNTLLWGDCSSADRPEQAAEELCHEYIRHGVAGVFFAPLILTETKTEVNEKILAALNKAHIPVVLLDRCVAPYPLRTKYDLVGIDNRRTAYVMTEHLIQQGARKIAFFAGPHAASTVEARIAGYHEALTAHNMTSQSRLVFYGRADDVLLVQTILDREKADAIFAVNDPTAVALMQTLYRLGRRVPVDVRVVGIDDIKYAKLLPTPLTTQHQPCAEIGLVAMSTMLQRLEAPNLPTRDVLLDCTLMVRESCGAHMVADTISHEQQVEEQRSR